MQILDIHSHREAPKTITALSAIDLLKQFGVPDNVILNADYRYSIGIHPWATVDSIPDEAIVMLNEIACRPEVVAIGEAGIDTLRGGPMFRQINTFKLHIDLSESIRKPLIIHNVKAHDIVLGIHRDTTPIMSWAIHGFRNKPQIAQMFTSRGIYLSFGPQYNADTLRTTPSHLILAETDDTTDTTIYQVIDSLSSALSDQTSTHTTDLTDPTSLIAANTSNFLTIYTASRSI